MPNTYELTIQHDTTTSDHVLVKYKPDSGVIYLRYTQRTADGIKITRRELLDVAEHHLEPIHDGTGWYLPLVFQAVRLADDVLADETARWKITAAGRDVLAIEKAEAVSNDELPPFLQNRG